MLDVEDPTFFRQSAHRWQSDFQPYPLPALYSSGRFQVFISVRRWVNIRAIVRLEILGKLKKFSDPIENRSRNLAASSAMLQATKLLIYTTCTVRAPVFSFHPTENTTCVCYENQPSSAIQEILNVYSRFHFSPSQVQLCSHSFNYQNL
jgi:hypothetical protein